MTSEISLIFYVLCHQSYKICRALIDPVPLTNSSLL